MDRAENLGMARSLLERAAAAGADLAVLPEYAEYLGPGNGAPEPIGGPLTQYFAKTARRLGMWVHLGSFHETGPGTGRTYNTSLVFDRAGRIAGHYRKIHLYDVEIPGSVSYRESANVTPGDRPIVVAVEDFQLGLSICYDLRFPELYRELANAGATVLVVPAAFMAHTGRDHWEVLLRARAIENQCYVVAAGQFGDHEPGRTCFGRSMVVDPWGTVLAQVPDAVGFTAVQLDCDRVTQVRTELPSLRNRRL
jgi:predicted amidohydrolase